MKIRQSIPGECNKKKNDKISPVHFNLLKTKRNLPYITIIKTNQLMMCKAKVAVCSDIRTKHSKQSERHVELLNVKPGGK
jgi:hypothetical protein